MDQNSGKDPSFLTYILYSIVGAVILILVSFPLSAVAPLDEPKVYAYGNAYYDLGVPVGVSFVAFINLLIFIISAILFWGGKNIFKNLIIDSSALSFVFLNYLNYYIISIVWHPVITVLPFMLLIHYNGSNSLQVDLGQIVLIIYIYRMIKRARRPRPLPGLESVKPADESPQPGGVQ
ncbi:hypothetical protein GWK48_04020 [Metallosphaera tengchongensis]|uniref:Uncharacterized protein n=1 Tax=Metallosphaera tengchongensis TaxID=1532350 RepID=A0A6N0NVE9_9CREN|nr:hypothetical protein [Metallosphaera tengchongensis]QKQ99668.1 hypothetical protein GWK48_04020 [Metallosphaera tengchongensis]